MASNGSNRRWLLSAGGVLSIVAGIFQINNGAVLMAYFLTPGIMPDPDLICSFLPGLWFHWWEYPIPAMVGWHPSILCFIMGLSILVLGIIAIVGGISAIRRKRFGLSLAGAICALASGLLGILAVVFVALGKREFRGEGPSGV
jgi:hypothetical protein